MKTTLRKLDFTKVNSKPVVTALCAGLSVVAVGTAPARAQVAIEISQDVLTAALSQCTTAASCAVAVQALIDQLVAANPNVDLAVVVGSVMSAIAEGYNNGTISATLAQTALAAAGNIASANNLAALATFAATALTVIAAGDPIDLEAVAQASGSPA